MVQLLDKSGVTNQARESQRRHLKGNVEAPSVQVSLVGVQLGFDLRLQRQVERQRDHQRQNLSGQNVQLDVLDRLQPDRSMGILDRCGNRLRIAIANEELQMGVLSLIVKAHFSLRGSGWSHFLEQARVGLICQLSDLIGKLWEVQLKILQLLPVGDIPLPIVDQDVGLRICVRLQRISGGGNQNLIDRSRSLAAVGLGDRDEIFAGLQVNTQFAAGWGFDPLTGDEDTIRAGASGDLCDGGLMVGDVVFLANDRIAGVVTFDDGGQLAGEFHIVDEGYRPPALKAMHFGVITCDGPTTNPWSSNFRFANDRGADVGCGQDGGLQQLIVGDAEATGRDRAALGGEHAIDHRRMGIGNRLQLDRFDLLQSCRVTDHLGVVILGLEHIAAATSGEVKMPGAAVGAQGDLIRTLSGRIRRCEDSHQTAVG